MRLPNEKGVGWKKTPGFALTVALFSGSLIGCASSSPRMYDGPARPLDEVAVLEIPEALRLMATVQVDTTVIETNRAELLPGRYEVTVAVRVRYGGTVGVGGTSVRNTGTIAAPCTIIFEAQPGKTYLVETNKLPNAELPVTLSSTAWGTSEVYETSLLDVSLNDKVGEPCSTMEAFPR